LLDKVWQKLEPLFALQSARTLTLDPRFRLLPLALVDHD
jgi:hypothetical protein